MGDVLRVDAMPRLPAPYALRDWAQVTRDYVRLVLDPARSGDLLPIVRLPGPERAGFALPSYLGGARGAEAINCIALGVSGALVGVNMRHSPAGNWPELCERFYNSDDGIYTNGVGERAGGSFWYDLFPNILAFQLHSLYPTAEGSARNSRVAEQWRKACAAMGATDAPATPGDFDHTAFRFADMRPVNNGTWIEPDAAAAIAWLEYAEWSEHPDPAQLAAADNCIRALERRPIEKNPLYEVLLPYGALAAAKMNAELGRGYDVGRLVDWCFNPGGAASARPGWGVIDARFGADDCFGLAGSVTDTNGYAFAMNTFEWAGALTPIARYDPRFARSIGRWMLNLVNASRLFYPNALPASHQDNRDWADHFDAASCLGYEGLRNEAQRFATPQTERTLAGRVVAGNCAQTRRWSDDFEVLAASADGRLSHVWRLDLPAGSDYNLLVRARFSGPAQGQFHISYARAAEGPYTPAFTVDSTDARVYYTGITAGRGPLWVRAESAVPTASAARLACSLIRVGIVDPGLSPYATGDAMGNGAPSNLCLYGSSHVGTLGAIVGATNVTGILRLDLLKTDYYRRPAYPSALYYNPYDTPRSVDVDAGTRAVNLYDACTHRFLRRGVKGRTTVAIPADTALVLVAAPTHGPTTERGDRRLVAGVVIDYHCR